MKRISVVAVAVLTVLAIGIGLKGCLDVDRCLDWGSRWTYEAGECEYE